MKTHLVEIEELTGKGVIQSRQCVTVDLVCADEHANNIQSALDQANEKNAALIAALERSQQRIAELQPDIRNVLMPALDGLDESVLRSIIQSCIDNYSALHTQYQERGECMAKLESEKVTAVNSLRDAEKKFSDQLAAKLLGERYDSDGKVSSDYDRGWNAYRNAIK